MIIVRGAEKAPWLHRADTGTPVRRKIRAERRGLAQQPWGFLGGSAQLSYVYGVFVRIYSFWYNH